MVQNGKKLIAALAAMLLVVLTAVPAMAASTLAAVSFGVLALVLLIIIVVVVIIILVVILIKNKKQEEDAQKEAQKMIRGSYAGVPDQAKDPHAPDRNRDPAKPENRRPEPSGPQGGWNAQPSGPQGDRNAQPSGLQGDRNAQPSGPQGDWNAQPSGPQGDWNAQPSGPQGDWNVQPSVPQGGWAHEEYDETGSGETTLLDDGAGATTLLQNTFPEAYLVRKKTGEKIRITEPVFTIGKERQKVDYCVSDNSTVSRRHLVITRVDDAYYAQDQHSTNQTYIDDVQAVPEQKVLLADGSLIRISDEEFAFYLETGHTGDI